MSLNAQELVGFQRRLYQKSSKFRIMQFVVQIAVAVPAALAVVLTGEKTTYLLAVVGLSLLVLWWVINSLYTSVRGSAHAARRAAILVGGLNHPLSPLATAALQDRLGIAKEEAKSFQKFDYFASGSAPGAQRLGEMIEESAFYSAPLQLASARSMMVLLLVFAAIAAGVALAGPFFQEGAGLMLSRVVLAVSAFVMSSDVFGSYVAHRKAASEIDGVRSRMMALGHGEYVEGDVLLALTDYQSAVESAPEVVPFIYSLKEKKLNDRWADYQKNRDDVRAAKKL